MSDFLLCQTADVGEGEMLECDGPDGDAVLVICQAGKFFAVQGECPHQGAPLAEGELEDGELTCALHFWKWRIADGAPLEDAEAPLKRYALRIADGAIYLTNGGE